MSSTNPKDIIIERIKALRSKTEEAGATEAEALVAAKMAAKLMEEYDVVEAELIGGRTMADLESRRFRTGRSQFPPVLSYTWKAIMSLTHVAFTKVGGELEAHGLPSDIELAHYLHDLILTACENEWQVYRKARGPVSAITRNNMRRSFYAGFGNRVSHRLTELANERRKASSSTALVVCKDSLVTSYVEDKIGRTYNREGQRHRRKQPSHRGAYDAGQRAGQNLNLNRPLN